MLNIKKVIELDYNKPIACKDDGGLIYLLLPQHTKGNYRIVGYNWFDLKNFYWNSCCCFKTKELAVTSYGKDKCFNIALEEEIL